MASAYRLTPRRVRQVIPENVTGFYRLGNIEDGEFWTKYFGRSDRDLRSRLMAHSRNRPKIAYFRPVVTGNIRRAYELECREWHLRGDQVENHIHPARPRHIDYHCPYCDLVDWLTTN